MSRPASPPSPAALAYSINDAAAVIGIGPTLLEELIARGEIKSFKVGRRRLVSRAALEAFVTKQEKAA